MEQKRNDIVTKDYKYSGKKRIISELRNSTGQKM